MSGPAVYTISEDIGVVASIVKQNADVRELLFDFSQWLAASETITTVGAAAVATAAPAYGWQVDFPFPTTTPSVDDTHPITAAATLVTGNTEAQLLISSGTPGLGYVVSFVATSSNGRKKEVDVLVTVNEATNASLALV